MTSVPLYDVVCEMLQSVVSFLWNASTEPRVRRTDPWGQLRLYCQPQFCFRWKGCKGTFTGFLMVQWLHLMLSPNWPCIQDTQSMMQYLDLWQSHTPRPGKSFPSESKKDSWLQVLWRERGQLLVEVPMVLEDSIWTVKALSEVVHLLKKVEHAQTVEYLVCTNLTFHSFVAG